MDPTILRSYHQFRSIGIGAARSLLLAKIDDWLIYQPFGVSWGDATVTPEARLQKLHAAQAPSGRATCSTMRLTDNQGNVLASVPNVWTYGWIHSKALAASALESLFVRANEKPFNVSPARRLV